MDRQTDRQKDRQTNRQTDKSIGKLAQGSVKRQRQNMKKKNPQEKETK